MASQQTFLTLNSGYKIPQLGFGTMLSIPHEVERPIVWAIEAGYRHIDCAHVNNNEIEVGNALKKKFEDGTVKREDMFITSKLWSDSHRLKDVRPACMESLQRLRLNYLDLFLVHMPVSFKVKEGMQFSEFDMNNIEFDNVPLEETWKGMEELVERGLVRSIGVSNFNKAQIDRILASCSIPPAVNQIEVSVNWPNQKLIRYCQSKGIQITGYSPFGVPGIMQHFPSPLAEEYVEKFAQAHWRTPVQVLIRHAIQRGISVISHSVNKEMIKISLDVFDFSLTDEEMRILNTSGRNIRVFDAAMSEDISFDVHAPSEFPSANAILLSWWATYPWIGLAIVKHLGTFTIASNALT